MALVFRILGWYVFQHGSDGDHHVNSRSKTACNAAISACSKAAAWSTAFSLFDHMAPRQKSDVSDRSQVFWFLLRLMFLDQMLLLNLIVEDVFGVFWMGIGIRCLKSTFLGCRPEAQASHAKWKTKWSDQNLLVKISKLRGVEQTLWRHHFIQCSIECLWQGAAVDFGLEYIGDHVEWIRFGGCGVFPVFRGLRFGDANP